MLPAGGGGGSHPTIRLTESATLDSGQAVYLVESMPSVQSTAHSSHQQTQPQKLLLSSVVSMAANSRVKADAAHRGVECVSCETCRSRLQKLDELELKQAELEMMLQIYQKKLDLSKRLLDEYHAKEKTFLDNVGKIFNGDQIVRILTGHCQKRRGGSSWDDGTLKKAAKLYFLCSPQGYQEILHLKMPLPSSHTLQNVIQKGRPQPLSPKTSVFDPFASTSDVSSSIALVRRGIVQQNRSKDSTPLGTSNGRSFQQQQQQQFVVPSSASSSQATISAAPGIVAAFNSALSTPTHLSDAAVVAGITTPASIQKMAIPRGVYTSKVGGLDLPDELARMVNEAVTSNDGGDEAVIVESSRLQDQDILNRSERQEEQLVGHEESTEPPLSQEQVNIEPPVRKDMSIERAVGAVVRSLVDQVARAPAARSRAPYVSILRNPNDPNAPAKYNLVVPRHLLRPGQRIVLKAGAVGARSSAPTVQIIEPLRSAASATPTAVVNPASVGSLQNVNVGKRLLVSSSPAIVLRSQAAVISPVYLSQTPLNSDASASRISDSGLSVTGVPKRLRLGD